jgi:hypothetical protein
MAREAEQKKTEVAELQREVSRLKKACFNKLCAYFITQLAHTTEKHEKRFSNLTTPSAQLLKEGATDDQEEGQMVGETELNLEGVSNVGSEMERVHIQERNKAMAAKLKVLWTIVTFMITVDLLSVLVSDF